MIDPALRLEKMIAVVGSHGHTYTATVLGYSISADVALMRRVVGAEMGVKAAGGVYDTAVKSALATGTFPA